MNLDITLIHSTGKIAFTIFVLLAFFLLTVNSKIKKANYLFAAFLLLVAFDLCGLFMYQWLNAHPYIDLARRTCSLLQMPLVYFYVKAMCYQDFKIRLSHLWHFIPFIFILLLFLSKFVYLDTILQAQLLQNTWGFEILTKNILGELQYFFYIILIFKTLADYKRLYQENYSSFDQTAYQWLVQMTVISLCAHLFALTKDIMVVYAPANWVLMAHLVVSLIVLGVICWLVLKALYHPSITRGLKSDQEPVSKNKSTTINSKDLSPEIKKQLNAIKTFMKTQEPYLDAELNIESLAKMYELPSKELSTLINHHLGQNFFSFVNSFRIKKAQHLLKNPANNQLSVLEILYQVGFNSKSSFNTAFKKHTGLTPTAFRKSHKNQVFE